MALKEGILSTIGNTPLIRLHKYFKGNEFQLFAKLEIFNPGGSVKDRSSINILRCALDNGYIVPGTTIIESSSGNMGIGLAQVCSYYGMRLICVVDPKTTSQNLNILQAYGAEIDVVKEPSAVTGEFLQARLDRVQVLLKLIDNSFWPDQYSNIYNSTAHHQTMHEIIKSLDGKIDYLFCATSTCGTIRGCSEYLRMHGLKTQVIAVDALGSVIFGGNPAKRLIPGHGASVRPKLYHEDIADRCIQVSDLDCVIGCRRLIKREAILAGGSSGGVLMAVEHMKKDIPLDSTCVVILADRGERYLNTIYSDAWVKKNFGFISHYWENGV
jgi:N-(2-amino-2-carboxyethyl)-L-glutamate synthase